MKFASGPLAIPLDPGDDGLLGGGLKLAKGPLRPLLGRDEDALSGGGLKLASGPPPALLEADEETVDGRALKPADGPRVPLLDEEFVLLILLEELLSKTAEIGTRGPGAVGGGLPESAGGA